MSERAPIPEPAPKVYRPRVLGALGRVALALTSFALVLVVMHAVAAPSGGSVIGGKLQYWREHAREYDTVFVGSSHVFRAFVPEEFDRSTAELGVQTHSFNFGVQAVQLLEQRYLMHRILEARPGLARIFFEYQWLCPQVDPDNAFNPRTVYWHDADSTRLAIERSLHWGQELGDGLSYVEGRSESRSIFTLVERQLVPPGERAAGQHAQHFLTDLLMIGRGKDVLRGLMGREHGQTARYRLQDGYLSLEDDERALAAQGDVHNTYAARHERFLAQRTEYLRAVDELDAAQSSFGDGDWVNPELARLNDLELIRQIADEARAHGTEFVLVILPSQSADRPFEERLMAELGALVLRYNLPEQFPRLYEIANRYDSGHLSAEGALYFSRLLARDYAMQGGGRAPAGELPGGDGGGMPQ